ncbi:MAG: tyrosine-type recombinase/integrase [Bacteroidetes bacterium]|nr:tyrosine-type recombinase/integrase [Bacteroidota bacterium]
MLTLELQSQFNGMSIEDINTFEILLKTLKNDKLKSKYELAKFCDEYMRYLEANVSVKYCGSVKLSIKHLFEYFNPDKSIDEITSREIELFILKLRKSAPKGYKVYFRNLKAAFNKAKDWDYIKSNPFDKIKLRKEQKEYPTFITKDELNRILISTDNDVLRDIFSIAFNTGCRLNEILNLRWRNIDLFKNIITIGDSHFNTKSKAQRIIPLCRELEGRFRNSSQKSMHDPDGFVFTKPNGFKYNDDYVSKYFKKVCRKIGLDEKIHFHSLRHSFASFLVQQGINLYTVKELMGHSSITTTEIYSHLNTEVLHKAVEVFNAA